MAQQKSVYPEGDALEAQITKRHRIGRAWHTFFLAATITAIVVLLALLYNIVNSAFGLVAVQSEVAPKSLVLAVEEERMLTASNVVSSEDDNDLAAGVMSDADAIGFFGYAYYLENADALQVVAVDGVMPAAETAVSGEYPLSRSLYIYTTADIMAANPAVSAFVNYYLTQVNGIIEDVGYFPASAQDINAGQIAWLGANGYDTSAGRWVTFSPEGLSGTIAVAGSSTVFPLTQRIADMFSTDGFQGSVNIESIGSTAGLQAFCVDGSIDIANASRPINQAELEACKANGRTPIEIRVGVDALAIVVNPANTSVTNVTGDELKQIFTSAETWSDVNASWPQAAIQRYLPGADSGTLDFFSETVFDEALSDLPKETLVSLLQANISVGLGRRLERDQRFFANTLVFEDEATWAEVCSSDDPPAGCTLPERSQENVYELVLERVVVPQAVQTWSLVDSIFHRGAVLAEAAVSYPNAEVEFRSWLTPQFLTRPQSSEPELAGVRTAVLGSLWVIGITVLFSFPIGVSAAIYLEEYASDTWLNRLLQTNINNLAGVPSIIYG
ncbi:MAG: substrate-binding domain-containing protein, partial [Anaerolineales bacterium]|nr:substrate-binding domain-containing protein [Anaerolineales bacterium]